MKSKTLKNNKTSRKKYGGMHSLVTKTKGLLTSQGSKTRGSKSRGSQKQVSMPQIVRIKPSFEEEFKAYCMNNFIGSDYIYHECTEILPGIYKDDTKKRNTMYLLIFIISMLSVMLKDKCKIIIKGGLAVLFAVSSHQEHIPYSTKDIDLLIQPLDGNDGLFHARFIGNMIMWIFDGIDERRFNKLSLLDESAREMQEKQLLKISMINDTGPGHGKFTAAIDINIHLPDDKRFYWPDENIHLLLIMKTDLDLCFFMKNNLSYFFLQKGRLFLIECYI
jgi:hypothetical protein